MELGKQLVQLLHKEDIVQAAPFATAGKIQPCAMNIINRAKELCTKGDLWHHHMLFPDCIFNKHQGKWTIMFEDLENKKIMESISDEEPRSVLREIEILFYKQKNS